ncbi:MAG: outer membrane protein assembly factor BamD [Candidatus Omnitrophica bacterium]|nr:outer membrane protein assembly factor BamD [Candidatus Omnitrophota bacterium]
MRPVSSIVLVLAVVFTALFSAAAPAARAFWIWTPESGKWVNPKYDVKPSPKEQLSYAQGFFDEKKYPEALREYKKLLKHYGKSREAAEGQFYIGRVWEEMKKYFQAVDAYQKVIDRYPFSDLGPKVVERQYVIANLFMEGKAKDSRFATSLLGNEYNVVDVFRKVIKNDPYGAYAPSAQFKIGLFYLGRNEYSQARDEFEKTLNDYPDTKWAESARYQIAVADAKRSVPAQYDQKVTNVAVAGFEDFVKSNPESELSADAKKEIDRLRLKEAENAFVVARFYQKSKESKSALIYYQGVVDKYGDTPWAAKARTEINMIKTGAVHK